MTSGGQPSPAPVRRRAFPQGSSQRSIVDIEQLMDAHSRARHDNTALIGAAMAESGAEAGPIERTVKKPHIFRVEGSTQANGG
jgi:hypothetical protein